MRVVFHFKSDIDVEEISWSEIRFATFQKTSFLCKHYTEFSYQEHQKDSDSLITIPSISSGFCFTYSLLLQILQQNIEKILWQLFVSSLRILAAVIIVCDGRIASIAWFYWRCLKGVDIFFRNTKQIVHKYYEGMQV